MVGYGVILLLYFGYQNMHLQHQIYVWNKNNGQILVKVRDQYDVSILNIIYRNNHFNGACGHI
jgi:hypothetical protein